MLSVCPDGVAGYERYNAMRADPALCFLEKVGMPDEKLLSAEQGVSDGAQDAAERWAEDGAKLSSHSSLAHSWGSAVEGGSRLCFCACRGDGRRELVPTMRWRDDMSSNSLFLGAGELAQPQGLCCHYQELFTLSPRGSMEKEEGSGEKLDRLSKQEVSGTHSVRYTSDATQPALWCRLGSISSAVGQ